MRPDTYNRCLLGLTKEVLFQHAVDENSNKGPGAAVQELKAIEPIPWTTGHRTKTLAVKFED